MDNEYKTTYYALFNGREHFADDRNHLRRIIFRLGSNAVGYKRVDRINSDGTSELVSHVKIMRK